jgi:hypothetical protein
MLMGPLKLISRGNPPRKAKGFAIWGKGYFYNIRMIHFFGVEEGSGYGGHTEFRMKSMNDFVEYDAADEWFVPLKIENPFG